MSVTSTRPVATILAALWLTGALAFLICEATAAAAVTPPYSYSYASDFISQLGVPGWTGLAAVMNAGFYLQGILLLGGAVLAVRESATGHRHGFLVLAALYALGAVLVATFHAGPGAAADNLLVYHWLGSLLVFLGGNAAILAGSSVVADLVGVRWYRKVSLVLAVLGFLSFVVFGNPAARPYLGVWERGSVYPLLLWQMLSAALLLARRSADTSRSVTS